MIVIIIRRRRTRKNWKKDVNCEHSVIKMEIIVGLKKDVWQKQNIHV